MNWILPQRQCNMSSEDRVGKFSCAWDQPRALQLGSHWMWKWRFLEFLREKNLEHHGISGRWMDVTTSLDFNDSRSEKYIHSHSKAKESNAGSRRGKVGHAHRPKIRWFVTLFVWLSHPVCMVLPSFILFSLPPWAAVNLWIHFQEQQAFPACGLSFHLNDMFKIGKGDRSLRSLRSWPPGPLPSGELTKSYGKWPLK